MSLDSGLFGSLPDDVLNFGYGSEFNAQKVPQFLGLKKEDVSRIAAVSVKSVRYDDAMPALVRERLEEIANTANWVAQAFNGDVNKTAAWFRACNPLLGDVFPRDMIRLGRYERLRKFIINAMNERLAKPQAVRNISKGALTPVLASMRALSTPGLGCIWQRTAKPHSERNFN